MENTESKFADNRFADKEVGFCNQEHTYNKGRY